MNLGAVAVACPHCKAAAGEFCHSDKGREWKASTHYVRRMALTPITRRRTAAKRKLQAAIIKAAIRFCEHTAEDFAALDGSASMDIPVEFTELHEAVNARRKA